MKFIYPLMLPLILLTNWNCNKSTDNNVGNSGTPVDEWLIPRNRVVDGGPGKDGIPALNNPEFFAVQQGDSYLTDNDLVIGYRKGNEIRAYSHNVLNWHEIVNDEVDGNKIAVIYCPLTGTGTCWNRLLSVGETTFGVSGLLYNTNVIPYDRKTNSNWSQMLLKSVNGPLIRTEAENFQLIETSWKTWKEMFPSSKVLSTNTGFSRIYTAYPYGDYRTNHNFLLFGLDRDDNRLPRKERVLGIIKNSKAKVYRFSSLSSKNGIIKDFYKGDSLVIAGNTQKNIMVAFMNKLPDGSSPNFILDNSKTGLLKDQFGNVWDAFGVAISGPLTGQRLQSPLFIMGFWMAFGSFYPNAEIYSS